MIKEYLHTATEKKGTIAILAIAAFLCTYVSLAVDYRVSIGLGLLPFILIFLYSAIYKPIVSIALLFVFNYFVMGINRYASLPIPMTNFYDLSFCLFFAGVAIRQLKESDNFKNILNFYFLFTLAWALYCIINLGNHITGDVELEAWIKTVRVIAFYSLFTCIAISITCKHYTFLQYILIIWGVLTLLGAAKGYWQRNRGFDATELAWLMDGGGGRTHLIHSGIRYFSFFSDAANFGCTMGLSAVVFLLTFISTKHKYLKLFYLLVGLSGAYGLLISGTRAAMAIPVAGLGLYILLSKGWKIKVLAAILLIGGVGILKYTTIGESNRLIRRMRTAFNWEDPSFQARLNNQKALRTYMAETPFGIGIGVNTGYLPPHNKYYFVATCPPDSDLVNIWIQTGEIGLTIYLVIQCLIYLTGSYLLLFRIRNPEIRGPLTAMLCGCAGMLVASYGNNISFMFPNGPIIFTCLTLVFLGPYFDKQYTAEHGRKTA